VKQIYFIIFLFVTGYVFGDIGYLKNLNKAFDVDWWYRHYNRHKDKLDQSSNFTIIHSVPRIVALITTVYASTDTHLCQFLQR